MLLAIDVGNTDLKAGIRRDGEWIAVWRRPTRETGLEQWLLDCLDAAQILDGIRAAACASVVPAKNGEVQRAVRSITERDCFFLEGGNSGLEIRYEGEPGADRIANALGALSRLPGPVIVVDFGSSTTLDVVDASHAFVGGAIMPGVRLLSESLNANTAQLSETNLSMPEHAIGSSTQRCLNAGVVLGHLCAVEGLIAKSAEELSMTPSIIATGGFAPMFVGHSQVIRDFVPHLTLDGIAVAYNRYLT